MLNKHSLVATSLLCLALTNTQPCKAQTKIVQQGKATLYWQDRFVACQKQKYFNPKLLAAAHRELPFGTEVLVINNQNGKATRVTINDRGPYPRATKKYKGPKETVRIGKEKRTIQSSKIIDLTPAAAKAIGLSRKQGVVDVTLIVLSQPANQANQIIAKLERLKKEVYTAVHELESISMIWKPITNQSIAPS